MFWGFYQLMQSSGRRERDLALGLIFCGFILCWMGQINDRVSRLEESRIVSPVIKNHSEGE